MGEIVCEISIASCLTEARYVGLQSVIGVLLRLKEEGSLFFLLPVNATFATVHLFEIEFEGSRQRRLKADVVSRECHRGEEGGVIYPFGGGLIEARALEARAVSTSDLRQFLLFRGSELPAILERSPSYHRRNLLTLQTFARPTFPSHSLSTPILPRARLAKQQPVIAAPVICIYTLNKHARQ